METQDLLMVALQAFPELKARGFFTIIAGVEHYFSALQEMKVETTYKSFYEEYDVAFSLRCTYSICDWKNKSRWIRIEGDKHVYRTPLLYVINRFDLNESPEQIASRMMTHYRANALVIEKYNHPEYSVASLSSYLKAHNIYFVMKSVGASDISDAKTSNVNSTNVTMPVHSESSALFLSLNDKPCKELQSLF
jgi:hypothetical protein